MFKTLHSRLYLFQDLVSDQADPTRMLDDTRASLESDSASEQANGDTIQRLEGELAKAGEHILQLETYAMQCRETEAMLISRLRESEGKARVLQRSNRVRREAVDLGTRFLEEKNLIRRFRKWVRGRTLSRVLRQDGCRQS